MGFIRHFRALMWKNAILKRRSPGSAIAEVLLPIAFVALMLVLKQLKPLQDRDYPSAEYTSKLTGDTLTVLPFSVVPARLLLANQRVAVLSSTSSAASAAAAFTTHMSSIHTPVNFSTIGGTGMDDPILRSIYVPGWSDVMVTFSDDSALASYIASDDYPSATKPAIWASIVFNAPGPGWDYSIRMNGSDATSTGGPPVFTFLTSYFPGPLRSYVRSTPNTAGTPQGTNSITRLAMPGFMTLQLAVDRWLIQKNVSLNEFDPYVLVDTVATALASMGATNGDLFYADILLINQTDPVRCSRILSDLATWLTSESYAPQQVDIVPMPVSAYKINLFFQIVLPTLTLLFVMAYLLPVTRMIRGLVLEKELRLREALRIMSLSDAAHFLSWYCTYAIIFTVISMLIAALGVTIFPHSEPSLIFLLFTAWGFATTSFCLMVSVFFTRARTASVIGGILFFAAFFAFFAVNSASATFPMLGGGSILAPTALGLAVDALGTLEANGIGLTARTWAAPGGTSGQWSVASSFGMLVLDAILYAAIAMYADAVLPAPIREFGVPRPWYFPFTLSYWNEVFSCNMLDSCLGKSAGNDTTTTSSSRSASLLTANQRLEARERRNRRSLKGLLSSLGSYVMSVINGRGSSNQTKRTSLSASSYFGGDDTDDAYNSSGNSSSSSSLSSDSHVPLDPSYVEEPDSSLRAKENAGRCVSVRGLRKEFDTPDGTKVAVDDVDLTMYEGQIFVLLGHNGAGKTTTISMLTGLIPATDGTASVFGRDVGSQLADVRKDLGVCPQHDVLWPDLTVREHLELYAAIKGIPQKDVQDTIKSSLALVGLTEKVNDRAANLSGGQKRKLSVTIAFMGGSKVIFLDEPTSGMDPYSRRSTWQILQNAREGRVIVLTTHFMDEADILGDRLAIMSDGRVRCVGTPMFLKDRFGVGYVLHLVLSQPSTPIGMSVSTQVENILSLVRSHVSAVTVSTHVGAELSLRLPLASSPSFPALLTEIDNGLATLGIASYGISVTSIEDVFLQVAEGSGHGVRAAPSQQQQQQNAITMGDSDTNDSDATKLSYSAPSSTGSSSVMVSSNPLTKLKNNTYSSSSSSSSNSSNSSSNAYGTSSLSSQQQQQPFSAPKNSVEAVRAAGRIKQEAWGAFRQHFGALLTKRARYSRRDYRALCCQLLIPVVLLCAGLGFIRSASFAALPDYRFTTANFNVDGFNPQGTEVEPEYPNYVPVFEFKSSGSNQGVGTTNPDISALVGSISPLNLSTDGTNLLFAPTQAAAFDTSDTNGFITATSYPERDFQRMSSFLLANKNTYAASKYGAYMFTRDGTLLPNQDATLTIPNTNAATYSVFVNTTARHGAPTFMNMMNSALLRSASADAQASISARNHPLPLTAIQAKFVLSAQSLAVVQVILIAMAFVPASFIMFIVKEREAGAKHQQIVSGVSTPAYWLANFLYDVGTHMLPATFTIIAVYAFSVGSLTSTNGDRFAALILNILAFGPSSAALCYALSHVFKSHSTAQAAIVMLNIISFGAVLVMLALQQVDSTCSDVPPISAALRILPMFAFGNAMTQLSLMDLLPQLKFNCDASNGQIQPASAYTAYTSALDFGVTGAGLTYMVITSFAYLLLAVILDSVLAWPKVRQALDFAPKGSELQPQAIPNEDEDVRAEEQRIEAASRNGGTSNTDVILLDHVRKVYSSGKTAVRSLSFGVELGGIFGFLGINGAGKTSTLKILTGDAVPTAGSAKLAGFDVVTQQLEVRRLLGYCPQHDALLELLTAREHLELYARVKGVNERDIHRTVNDQLIAFDLKPYANKLAGSLSGGNKRKLSVAIALIGNPPLVFLDEPSTGMDPVAKRFMWSVISRVATERKQCSIILTTHSMEEVEALCTRIGIMVGGRLRCLGSSQHLRQRHGQGFVSQMTLSPPSEETLTRALQVIQQIVNTNNGNGNGGGANNNNNNMPVEVSLASLGSVCTSLGRAWRIREITPNGSGWALLAAAELHPEKKLLISEFAAWMVEEDAVEEVTRFVERTFLGSHLVERQGLTLNFAIPPPSSSLPPSSAGKSISLSPSSSSLPPLAKMFADLEGARTLGVRTYTLGQTTLEQVFNSFAAQQEEETIVARGFGTAVETELHVTDAVPEWGAGGAATANVRKYQQ